MNVVVRAERWILASTMVLALVSCGSNAITTPADSAGRGKDIARQRGCVACHSITGRDGVGPTWKGLAGSTVALTDGTHVLADTTYLIESIREPSARSVNGFSAQMPQLGLAESDVLALVAYIESLR